MKRFSICVLSSSVPVRSSSAGGHICIRLFAETSPWRPCHVWRPPVISSVHCVKWAMTSSTLSFCLSHTIPHCSSCFPILHYCVCVSMMQEDNSYSPTKSWVQRITGQNSLHYSEWDSRHSSSWHQRNIWCVAKCAWTLKHNTNMSIFQNYRHSYGTTKASTLIWRLFSKVLATDTRALVRLNTDVGR